MKNSVLFFRNDDVRGTLDDSLVQITNIFIKHNIPLTHVVEPANVTPEVVTWLLGIKNQYPDLIEIGQHGYDHKLRAEKVILGKTRKGEFGFARGYDEQFQDMLHGKELMDKYFGSHWFPIFTFPFGGKNAAALRAADNAGYKIINDHMQNNWQHKLFDLVGHILRRNFLLQRSVSWHLRNKPCTSLFAIDVNISVIKRYIDSEYASEMYPLAQLIAKTRSFAANKTIGVVLHHRFHNSPEKIKLIDDYLSWCKEQPNFEFMTQQQIYDRFKTK